MAALVAEIEAEAEAIRRKKGIPVLGVRAILQQNPHTEPNRTKRSPAPRFHAASKAVRNGLREMYSLFLAAFRDAAEQLGALSLKLRRDSFYFLCHLLRDLKQNCYRMRLLQFFREEFLDPVYIGRPCLNQLFFATDSQEVKTPDPTPQSLQ